MPCGAIADCCGAQPFAAPPIIKLGVYEPRPGGCIIMPGDGCMPHAFGGVIPCCGAGVPCDGIIPCGGSMPCGCGAVDEDVLPSAPRISRVASSLFFASLSFLPFPRVLPRGIMPCDEGGII